MREGERERERERAHSAEELRDGLDESGVSLEEDVVGDRKIDRLRHSPHQTHFLIVVTKNH
jgi:hypothetical protein